MLIFDRFPDRGSAAAFAAGVFNAHGLAACVFASVDDAQAADPIPVELTPPIVHVMRSDDTDLEAAVVAMVDGYGGTFQGT